MKRTVYTQPQRATHLADLVVYLLALKVRRPDLAARARRAIQEGRYYEQN